MVEAGCLASYGITIPNLYALSADQIARLLNVGLPITASVRMRGRCLGGPPRHARHTGPQGAGGCR
jgi:hypothetical protein